MKTLPRHSPRRRLTRAFAVCAVLCLSVSVSAETEGPALALISFWVPSERHAEFAVLYEAEIRSWLAEQGIEEHPVRGRPTIDGVFPCLFVFPNPGGLCHSTDCGESWSLNRPLWDRAEGYQWFGGGEDCPSSTLFASIRATPSG